MGKRSWAVLIAGSLIASVFSLTPARAQEAAPTVPAEPNIVDPVGDANYANDGNVVPVGQDNTSPADVGSVSDIVAVWFSQTVDKISVHIQTEAPGPATTALFYRVRIDPGSGANCLWMTAAATGAGNPEEASATLRDTCDGDVSDAGEFTQVEGPDGTGIHTISFDRAQAIKKLITFDMWTERIKRIDS